MNSAHRLNRRAAILAFLAFAVTYFLSALIRAITATLSPNLTQEFGLSSGDLGLLAGAYFFGFAITQLPLGSWLDRLGPKKVILRFVAVAVLACLAFSWAEGFGALLAARFLCGVGLSACLMAPLTGYRRWFDPASQLRANSWMLMTGSLGMMASTLPVQWLLPVLGWRPLFWGPDPLPPSYAMVWRDPFFRSLLPLAFFSYGGLLAVQNLWAAPWMTEVAGYSALQAATALFWINVAMLCTFWVWGMASPWLARHGLRAERLVELGLPASFLVLAVLIGFGNTLSDWTGACWALYCVCCTVVSLTQPAVGMAFAPALAGRALSAFNLVIFSGVFLVQWGIGLGVDRLVALGLSKPEAFRATMALFLLCCVVAYIYFVLAKRDNPAQVNS
ncbi:MAG: MFS transporter [Burkholderiales bacterium]|nr:MFS transporter [Burkholderiales bacterium]